MKVVVTAPVEIAIRTLEEKDREQVREWVDRLKNWGKDDSARSRSHRLDESDNTYVLHTWTDIRIFFALEDDKIIVLDVAKKASILTSGGLWGEGGR